jgi:hypothetical protein
MVAGPRFEPIKQPIPSGDDFIVVRNARRRRTQPRAMPKRNELSGFIDPYRSTMLLRRMSS